MFISNKLNEDLNVQEFKPTNVLFMLQCNLCDARYMRYTRRHLNEHLDGRRQKSSPIYKLFVIATIHQKHQCRTYRYKSLKL